MRKFLSVILLVVSVLFALEASAQTSNVREKYKVKKQDTLYGIAKKYEISVDALIEANPEMKVDGYQLKKGDIVAIPFATAKTKAKTESKTATQKQTSGQVKLPLSGKSLSVGVMLPLHDVDGDGRRMVEYYRGILLACDDLRTEGMAIDVHAWNVNIDADITKFMPEATAAKCDLIFGPLYTKQVHALAEYCKARDVRMVIPFSITGDDVAQYSQIFQVYQTNARLNNSSIESFIKLFPNAHPVFIDCNDKTSQKGSFTYALRNRLESNNITYGLTNLISSDDMFAKQFSSTQKNVVILNSARSPELTQALNKLSLLKAAKPEVKISLYGYTEWLMYLGIDEAKFRQFDTYIPSTFFYNASEQRTKLLVQKYKQWFKADMQQSLPRFALTGYDHAQFFLRGFAGYGKGFKGLKYQNKYTALQTPLTFKQIGSAGMQNAFFQLVHFRTDGATEAVSF